MVTVKCKGCGAPVGIDGTLPPPPTETTSPAKDAGPESDKANDNNGPGAQPVRPTNDRTASDKPAVDKAVSSEPPPWKAARHKFAQGKASGKVPMLENAAISKLTQAKAASEKAAVKTTNREQPAIETTVRQEPAPEMAAYDEPAQDAFATDDSWEPTLKEDDPDRFSHVDGPIPVRLPSARIGRYALFDQFAEGGIATVHFGRIDGVGGFSRVVAIKRLLAHLVKNEEFTEMLLKEARLAARVRHPNVVPTLDVVASQGDVLLVLEYVHGESLGALCRTQAKQRKDHVPVDIAVAVMHDVLAGLCAVHEATDEKGRLLGLVHRDISPPNVIVGADGYSRLLDFGIAKALEHIEESMPNRLKGKIGYMAPEQIRGEGVTQRSDVFAAGVILWELLATRRLFASSNESERMKQIVGGNYPRLGTYRPGLPRRLELLTMKALAADPGRVLPIHESLPMHWNRHLRALHLGEWHSG